MKPKQQEPTLFTGLLKNAGLPLPEAEYRFYKERKWRFDFAWPEYKIALEVEGGAWIFGRHTRGRGFIKDLEKYSEGAILGWCVLRTTPTDLLGSGIEMLKRALNARGFVIPAKKEK